MTGPGSAQDAVFGSVATVVGATGAVAVVTQAASLALLGLNVILALGGLYLLFLRIRRIHQQGKSK